MRRLRLGLLLVWVAFVGLPLAALVYELLANPASWSAWSETGRLLTLLRNTVLLVVGTLALAMPLGTLAGLLLYRSDLPGRFAIRRVIVLAMFVPLPLLASAWQAFLSAAGFGPIYTFPTGDTQTPDPLLLTGWARGLVMASVIHAAAALPWVVWLAGQGLLWVDRHVEEDALSYGGPWAAFRRVTLPTALPALGVAALWVGIQTSAEITITDMCQVRTFAEEVYTQFARPDPGTAQGADQTVARAMTVAIPPALATVLLAVLLAWGWRKRLPALGVTPPEEWPLLRLHSWRWAGMAVIGFLLLVVVAIPVGSLLWKTGAVPPDYGWSAGVALRQLGRAWQAQRDRLIGSLAWSAITGGAIALLALFTCWALRDRRPSGRGLLLALIVLWALPGPVIGLGLKATIGQLMNLEDAVSGQRSHFLNSLLYNGPSPLPVMWASGLRYLPCMMALLWPVLQLLPRDLLDAARTDGATTSALLRHVVLPLTAPAFARAALFGTALCLGELSASKLVETPGGETFTHEIFMQMHFGVNNHLAAMCVLLLIVVSLVGGLAALIPGRGPIAGP